MPVGPIIDAALLAEVGPAGPLVVYFLVLAVVLMTLAVFPTLVAIVLFCRRRARPAAATGLGVGLGVGVGARSSGATPPARLLTGRQVLTIVVANLSLPLLWLPLADSSEDTAALVAVSVALLCSWQGILLLADHFVRRNTGRQRRRWWSIVGGMVVMAPTWLQLAGLWKPEYGGLPPAVFAAAPVAGYWWAMLSIPNRRRSSVRAAPSVQEGAA